MLKPCFPYIPDEIAPIRLTIPLAWPRSPKEEHRRDVYLTRIRRIMRSGSFDNRVHWSGHRPHRVVTHTKNNTRTRMRIQTFHQNLLRALAAARSIKSFVGITAAPWSVGNSHPASEARELSD